MVDVVVSTHVLLCADASFAEPILVDPEEELV